MCNRLQAISGGVPHSSLCSGLSGDFLYPSATSLPKNCKPLHIPHFTQNPVKGLKTLFSPQVLHSKANIILRNLGFYRSKYDILNLRVDFSQRRNPSGLRLFRFQLVRWSPERRLGVRKSPLKPEKRLEWGTRRSPDFG